MRRRAALICALLAASPALLPLCPVWAQAAAETQAAPGAAEQPAPAPAPAADAMPRLAPSTTLSAPEATPAPAPEPVTPPPAAPAAAPEPSPAPATAPEAAPGAEAPAVPPPGTPVDPRADTGPIVKPPVHAGDSWIYRRSDGKSSMVMRQTAAKVTDEGIALRTELARSADSSTALYDREWGLLASGYNDYRPVLRYYAFPLYAGKRWSINSAVSNFGAGQTSRVKGEAWATGWEQVEVPAGKFLALKIEIDIETVDPGSPQRVLRVRETHWYARTVLRPVKVESHAVVGDAAPTGEVIEMLSYRME
ncbi:MAG TPA: hypothetical protein VH105_01115 [Burkholderiales bacterium]|jgi:hypothetical protein|nr:hypothetical protein [Burkholderiales bacterium]